MPSASMQSSRSMRARSARACKVVVLCEREAREHAKRAAQACEVVCERAAREYAKRAARACEARSASMRSMKTMTTQQTIGHPTTNTTNRKKKQTRTLLSDSQPNTIQTFKPGTQQYRCLDNFRAHDYTQASDERQPFSTVL